MDSGLCRFCHWLSCPAPGESLLWRDGRSGWPRRSDQNHARGDAVPTALIGLLPTYQNIGWIAPLLLLALRLTQGFALGGELPGTACYIFEAAPSERKSILC